MGTGLAATVRWEERRLLRRFGDDYGAYLAEVHDLAVFGQLVRRGEAKAEVLEQAIGALISG